MTDLSHLRAARTRTAGRLRDLRSEARALSAALDCEAAECRDLILERDRALADLAEARRVLEPLLADPHFGTDDWCVFCYDGSHTPECPVLRADALLGRGAGQPGEEGT